METTPKTRSVSSGSNVSRDFRLVSVELKSAKCVEAAEQKLPGGPEVENVEEGKQPKTWKQRFETLKTILGPGFVVGTHKFKDRVGNHAIGNFQWNYNHPNLERDAPTSTAIAYLDPGSIQADINVGTSIALNLE